MLTPTLLVFALAFGIATITTPALRRVAPRMGYVDVPSGRKAHRQPTPLLGGLAIYAAVVSALALTGDPGAATQLAGIVAGATLVGVVGAIDDRRPLPPVVKLLGQAAAVAILVASGVRTQIAGGGAGDIALTAVWMLAVTNALNFQDNMDGLAGGLAGIAAAWFVLLAVANGQLLVAPLAAAVVGACLGFLRYNFNPASIFMGDAGSLFLGFTLAALGLKLRFPGLSPTVSWMLPPLVLAPALFDLALVTVSRLRRGVNPFTTAGRDHLSHRLLALGATTREATMSLYLVACAAGALALLTGYAGGTEAMAVLVLVVALGGYALWWLELRPGAPRAAAAPAPAAPTAEPRP